MSLTVYQMAYSPFCIPITAALQACGAEFALGHHYGTFQLTDEGIEAPVEALEAARIEAEISEEQFRLLRPGQVFEVEAKVVA